MKISFIQLAFGENIKQLWDKGKLPQVREGFYGEHLTKENVTREHLLPKSLGGSADNGNIVLASRAINNARGITPINEIANPKAAKHYLEQFVEVNIPELKGTSYIQEVYQNLKQLGLEVNLKHIDITA